MNRAKHREQHTEVRILRPTVRGKPRRSTAADKTGRHEKSKLTNIAS